MNTPRRLWLVIALLLGGVVLRGAMLGRDVRFHADEALYASFARRIATTGDLLLTNESLDKPPLGLFITATSFTIFGPTEFAARIPTFFISNLIMATSYALARRLYSAEGIALITLLLVAICPMELAFAATVFHDPGLALWMLLTALLIARDRWGTAGVFAALAIATKQSAVQFLPIFIAVGAARVIQVGWDWRAYWIRLRQFALPILVCVISLILWSAARAAPVDFWTLGVLNPGAIRLIRADEVAPRFLRWSEIGQSITGALPIVIPVLLTPLFALRKSFRLRRSLIDLLLGGGVLATLALYWLLAYNLYDRYLLPLTVPILLLTASLMMYVAKRRVVLFALVGVLTLLILPYTVTALAGHLNIGGDNGWWSEIDSLAEAVNALPLGTPFYDHWLSWELRYYMGEHPSVGLIWHPSPESLITWVCRSAKPSAFAIPRYTAMQPDAVDVAARWLTLLDAAGVRRVLRYRTPNGHFELYMLDCSF